MRVPAAETRLHIQDLLAEGASVRYIARQARSCKTTIRYILAGQDTCDESVERRILAVPPPEERPAEIDPQVLRRLLAGERVRVPREDKPAYFKPLADRGWAHWKISQALYASAAYVGECLLLSQLEAAHAETAQYREKASEFKAAWMASRTREKQWAQRCTDLQHQLKGRA